MFMPDAKPKDFGDSFAQTFTYSLLLARLDGKIDLPVDTAKVSERLDAKGHSLLGSVVQVMGEAREHVSGIVQLLETTIAKVDPEKLRSRNRELWLHFYEDFLFEYNPKLRKEAGVYYTPTEVVGAQVRLVDHVLKSRFGLGLGDENVNILDPALGTGTYLLSTIDHVLTETENNCGSVPAAARSLRERLFGFELLIGPYAVAHLRIAQALAESDSDGDVKVFLTDTLEAPDPESGENVQLAMFGPARRKIAAEQVMSDRIKSAETPVTVVIGNPPYLEGSKPKKNKKVDEVSGHQLFDSFDGREPLIEDFLEPARRTGKGGYLERMHNLYVYFWRWAIWKACEQQASIGNQEHCGVVSFITPSSFLRGPGFVGMREHMRKVFDEIWIYDLGGDSRGTRPEPNVFNIRTPVAIVVASQHPKLPCGKVKTPEEREIEPAQVWYQRFSGTKSEKLAELESLATGDSDRNEKDKPTAQVEQGSLSSHGWQSQFVPQGDSVYWEWPALDWLFPWVRPGCQYKRKWPIAPDEESLSKRWATLFDGGEHHMKDCFREDASRKIDKSFEIVHGIEYPEVLSNQSELPPILSEGAERTMVKALPYWYRSFDLQYCLPDKRLASRFADELWFTKSNEQLYLSTLATIPLGKGPAATVSAFVPDLDNFRGSYGAKATIPLYRDSSCTSPNVNTAALNMIREEQPDVCPHELFAYIYGLTGTAVFARNFEEDLAEPGLVRVPITKNSELFSRVENFGRSLIHHATFGERFGELNEFGIKQKNIVLGSARLESPTPSRPYPSHNEFDSKKGTVSIWSDEDQTQKGVFTGVREEVWEYEVSGLKVVQSWLGYRMRNASGKKSSPLDDIHPTEWKFDQQFLELLWVIEYFVNAEEEAKQLLDEVLAGEIFTEDELPAPLEEEKNPPKVRAIPQQGTLGEQ